MKIRAWRWLAIFAAGGIVLQTTTTSCSQQLIEQAVSMGLSVGLQALFTLLLGGLGT